jgi:AmmeMemoRadiSam system protein B
MRHLTLFLMLSAVLLSLASCREKPVESQKQPVAKQEAAPAQPAKPQAKEEPKPGVEKEAKPAPIPEPTGLVRPPAVADQFYPGNPKELAAMVDGFLNNVRQEETKGKVIGLICPHAGYPYSGQVAAYSYNQIKGQHYDTVVLLGVGHRGTPGMVSTYPSGAYETPLGKVPINSELAAKIAVEHRDLIKYYEWADAPEHCLEVQLPFLQRVLKDFKIVPILMTACSKEECTTVAKAIAEACRGENVLLVASSDLSHDAPYDEANRVDKETMQSWVTMDPNNILAKNEEFRELSPCGRDGILTMIMTAKMLGADAVRLLKYANLGDITGNRFGRIVGYGAAVVYKSEPAVKKP